MEKIEKILISNIKPKEKSQKIASIVIDEKIKIEDLINYFIMTSDVKKDTCADAMKYIAKKRPQLLYPYIDILIEYITYNAPRVKWGVQEAIGNLAKIFPDELVKAIPALLKNTEETDKNNTVVRWCAAYGLTEILINNKKTRKELLPKIKEIIKRENNSGVKNVYLKALRRLEKE